MLIAGAGIGGLAAALQAAAAGRAVTVLDRAAEGSEAGAGVQLSPNACRVLGRMGLLDVVHAAAVRSEAVRIRRGRNGAAVARIPLGDAAERRFGAPFLLIHRGDLHRILLDAARRTPAVTLAHAQAVEGFSDDAGDVAVTVGTAEGPRTVRASGLVGADGLRSRVRAALFPAEGEPVFSGRTAWRALVPADRAPAFGREPCSNLWLGRNAHLVHYPVRGGALVNVVAIVDDGWRGAGAADLWAVPGDPTALAARFGAWCADARALVAAAPGWRVWPLFDRPPLRAWSRGRVTLLGDAAHPMLPFLAQGAAQAIEDAAALGAAVAGAGGIERAFAAYAAARRDRTARVQRESRRQGTVYHLGAPASLARDLVMRGLGPAGMLGRYDWLYGA